MTPQHQPPSAENLEAWRISALDYLAGQFGAAAPKVLAHAGLYPHSPLEGEGPVAIFRFNADRGGGMESYYVVVGQTEPNYYPAYGLNADEAFSLHLGTRFMLVMGVAQVPKDTAEGYDAAGDARAIVDRVAPDKPITNLRVAAAFDVEGQIHAVLHCELAGRPIYVMGRDAPPGLYERTDLSPHVVFRLHLGNLLRREASPDDA